MIELSFTEPFCKFIPLGLVEPSFLTYNLYIFIYFFSYCTIELDSIGNASNIISAICEILLLIAQGDPGCLLCVICSRLSLHFVIFFIQSQ